MIKTLNSLARQLAMSVALGLAACFSFNNPAEDVGNLQGLLVDENDRPAEGASCVLSDTAWVVTTGDSGAFHFVDVPEGSYELLCKGKERTGSHRENIQVMRRKTLNLGKVALGCPGVQYCCGLEGIAGAVGPRKEAVCLNNQWSCPGAAGLPGVCCRHEPGGGATITTVQCAADGVLHCPADTIPGDCSGGSGGGGGAGGSGGPIGYVEVSLTVDDTANKVYADGDLAWKGSMRYDPITWIAVYNEAWDGPFPKLYDDGPWTSGGHEPQNAISNDHKFGAVFFITPPDANYIHFEYDVVDLSYGDNATIRWGHGNESFPIGAGQKTSITAPDVVVKAFGSVDLKLVLDKASLAPRFGDGAWNLSSVKVTISSAAWKYIELKDDGTLGDDVAGDGRYTFVLSQYVGPGRPLFHNGLLHSGDAPEFVFVLGGDPYRDISGVAIKDGITGFTKTTGNFVPVSISSKSPRTSITVP